MIHFYYLYSSQRIEDFELTFNGMTNNIDKEKKENEYSNNK